MPGRYIGENTRLVYDLMQYTEENNLPGTLLMIDFEKAFDSVSWNFIDKTLEYFKFCPSFRRWISVFQNKSISAVSQAGFLSNFFQLGRGCRQGDPISSYIFLLCAEILSIRIKHNPDIKGIKIDENEHLISQYADDTLIILDGSEKSLKATMKEVEQFYNLSGLKINISKTQIVWIGSKKYSNNRLCADVDFKWTNNFTLLGIHFDVDLSRINFLNYDKKLVKIKSIIKQWDRRNLTPIGRLTLIKSLLISQLNHLFITLPSPSKETILELNDILFSSLWKSKVDKVKRKIVTQEYQNGGLKMINLDNYIKGLKSTWIRRLLTDNNAAWKKLVSNLFNSEKLIKTGSGYIDEIQGTLKNKFWLDVLSAYKEIQNKSLIYNSEDFLSQPLWYNKNIQINNKSVFYQSWFNKGIIYFNDLLNEDCSFLTFEEFQHKFMIRTNFITFMGIKTAIIRYMRLFNMNDLLTPLIGPIIPFNIKIFIFTNKGSKNMYNLLNKTNVEPTGKHKWNRIFFLQDLEWKNIYRLPFYCTQNSKLQWFQYRINHHIVVTNKFLFKIGKSDSQMCTFCDISEESILHLLWECSKTH